VDAAFQQVAYDLRTIALLNPRLALMLARGQPLAPRAYNMGLLFDAGAVGTIIRNSFQERMYQDGWIQSFTYTIRCPLADAGSIWKLAVDTMRKQNPYISIDMRVEGPDRFEITNGPTPIENAITTLNEYRNLLNKAWVIGRDSNLFVAATLDRNFSDGEFGEIPMTLWITMNCLELSGCNLRAIGFSEAVCALKRMDLYPRDGSEEPPPGDHEAAPRVR
jgi:hypothetical protein